MSADASILQWNIRQGFVFSGETFPLFSVNINIYRGADKSLARSTSWCILFDVRIFRLLLVFLYIKQY
jgi:hypothetical protein